MHEADRIIARHKKFTEQRLQKLKGKLSEINPGEWSLIVNGSYARREASAHSDFDYFILHDGTLSKTDLDKTEKKIAKIVKDVIGKMPSADGAFATAQKIGELTKNIGGNKDTNENTTRRILFLTEGLAVNNPRIYEKQRDELIERYVSREISNHQLGMFLLNDLIRYYRTVCVDFEFKTHEDQKPWGIRNIKLVFSRKLLYFSGILIAAEMAQRTPEEKRQIARDLIELPPIERIKKVCRSSADLALESYARFLSALEIKATRDLLENVPVDREKHPEQFKSLKNESHHFSLHLLSALKATYSESHPIHRALIV